LLHPVTNRGFRTSQWRDSANLYRLFVETALRMAISPNESGDNTRGECVCIMKHCYERFRVFTDNMLKESGTDNTWVAC
jgi:hypothetical protein